MGADINAKTHKGLTPFLLADHFRNAYISKLLLDKACPINRALDALDYDAGTRQCLLSLPPNEEYELIIHEAKLADALINNQLDKDHSISSINSINMKRLEKALQQNGIPEHLLDTIKTSEHIDKQAKEELLNFIDKIKTSEADKKIDEQALVILLRNAFNDQDIMFYSDVCNPELANKRSMAAKEFYEKHPEYTPSGFFKFITKKETVNQAPSLLMQEPDEGLRIIDNLDKLILTESEKDCLKAVKEALKDPSILQNIIRDKIGIISTLKEGNFKKDNEIERLKKLLEEKEQQKAEPMKVEESWVSKSSKRGREEAETQFPNKKAHTITDI
jgi:hypothetical protein